MLKHKLIPKRWGGGREREEGHSSHVAWLKPQKYINMKFSTGDNNGHWGPYTGYHPDSRIYSSSHPKNLCYVFIMENNRISWWKSLGRAKGKVSLRQTAQPIQWKERKKGKLWAQISGVCTQALTPRNQYCSVSCLPLKHAGGKEATLKKLPVQVRKSDFADAVQNNSPWRSSIIKGLEF